MGAPVVVLAHQGGWDEILYILGPIAVVVLLLALAKRRVESVARAAEQQAAGRGTAADDSVSGPGDVRSPHPPT